MWVFIGLIGIVIALMLILYSFSHPGELWQCLVGLIIGGISLAIILSSTSSNDKPTGNNEVSAEANQGTTTESSSNQNNNVPTDKLPDTPDKNQYYGKFPRDFPSDNKTGSRNKWWHDWAVYNTDRDPIICRDGVQVVVSGESTNDGGASAISVRTRVHPDGKPFTCDETKDPTKELSA